MGCILTSDTEQGILETMRFVAMVRGSHEVVVAKSAFEILQRARRDRPNLAVWDLEFYEPVETRRLYRWHEDPTLRSIPLMILAPTGAGNRHLISPLPHGITCLTKPIDLVELGLRIGELLDMDKGASSSPPPGHRRQIGDLVLDYNLFQVTVRDKHISLTPTEFKLLRYFLEHAGQTFSSERLLEEVWKYPPGAGSLDVVRMYVKRLRDKIEPDPRQPRYIVTIPGHGYQMPSPETFHESAGSLALAHAPGLTGDQHAVLAAHSPLAEIPLQQVFQALQAVTLTCQVTLTTVVRLMDELSRIDREGAEALPRHSSPAGGRAALGNGAVSAVHSLSELTAQLQTTVAQLQSGWPSINTQVLTGGQGSSEQDQRHGIDSAESHGDAAHLD